MHYICQFILLHVQYIAYNMHTVLFYTIVVYIHIWCVRYVYHLEVNQCNFIGTWAAALLQCRNTDWWGQHLLMPNQIKTWQGTKSAYTL